MNALSEKGVDIVDDQGGLYHVSGHANRPDLEAVHELLRPKIIIPMHGEHRHLREHAKLAAAKGIAAEVVTNGMMMQLSGDKPVLIERIEAGRTYLDGSAMIGAMDGVVRDRIRMALNGLVLATIIVDEDDKPLGDAWVEVMGLADSGRSRRVLADEMERDLSDMLGKAAPKMIRDDAKLEEAVKRVVRQVAMEEVGKKPEVIVVISRLVAE